jgi:hypothetical protein
MESKIFSLTMHGRGVVEGPKKVGVGGGEGVMAAETDCVGWGRVKRGVGGGGFQLAS